MPDRLSRYAVVECLARRPDGVHRFAILELQFGRTSTTTSVLDADPQALGRESTRRVPRRGCPRCGSHRHAQCVSSREHRFLSWLIAARTSCSEDCANVFSHPLIVPVLAAEIPSGFGTVLRGPF